MQITCPINPYLLATKILYTSLSLYSGQQSKYPVLKTFNQRIQVVLVRGN